MVFDERRQGRDFTDTQLDSDFYQPGQEYYQPGGGNPEQQLALYVQGKKPVEYYEQGRRAAVQSDHDLMEGRILFAGYIIQNPNHMAVSAKGRLSDSVKRAVSGHGIGDHRPFNSKISQGEFELAALLNILGTGKVIGGFAPLESPSLSVFINAPFVLLSDRNRPLCDEDDRLQSLRAVVVNGKYQPMIDYLRRMFPGVEFVTSEELTDEIFDTTAPPFRPLKDRPEIAAALRDIQNGETKNGPAFAWFKKLFTLQSNKISPNTGEIGQLKRMLAAASPAGSRDCRQLTGLEFGIDDDGLVTIHSDQKIFNTDRYRSDAMFVGVCAAERRSDAKQEYADIFYPRFDSGGAIEKKTRILLPYGDFVGLRDSLQQKFKEQIVRELQGN